MPGRSFAAPFPQLQTTNKQNTMELKTRSLFRPLGSLALFVPFLASAAPDYGTMPLDNGLLEQWRADLATTPIYQAPSGYPGLPGSVNLLTHLAYKGQDRDQGHSGTCWIWGCQAVMSIDYAIKNPGVLLLTNGFSVQFLASNVGLVDPLLMGGGTPNMVGHFYEGIGFAIPWSNTTADWTDSSAIPKTPSAWIHTQPNQPLSSITVSNIATFGLPEAQAIANIKSALDAGHPLWFNLTLANDADWEVFCTFWGKTNATEETVINLEYGDGHNMAPGDSHLMACVGYNDLDPDPANHYWLMLNSWGTGDGRRPNGTFRMAMHTKYSAVVIPGMGDPVPIFTWGLLDTQFTTKARKGVASLAINLQDASPGANSIQISGVSFPPAAAPTNVYAAGLSLNGQSFSCDPAKGTWTADTNGFHYLSGAGVVPGLQVDINPVTCTWSFTATNVSADQARYIDSHYGLNFSFAYQPTADAPSLDLGGLHAFMYDELANAASGQYTNPAPDAPSLSFRLTGAQGVLRIAGETGRTCQVQETGALGSLWAVRTIVPMTQPVQEVTLSAPAGTNRFWRVKVQ